MSLNNKIPNEVKTIINALENAGFEAFIVGGCVRDLIMDRQPVDFDITTSARPHDIKRVFKNEKTIDTGIQHGTITVLINNIPFEITTYRADGEYLDNRRPKNVEFLTDIKGDLLRRDFTINAIAYNFSKGFVDITNGFNDIEKCVIKTVGNPDERFGEDALRIMRGLRFASVLKFQIDDLTKQSILKNKNLLQHIANERIRTELLKLLCGDNAGMIINEYIDVFKVIIPEIAQLENCPQNTPYHLYDVLGHTLASVDLAEKDPVLRLCVLFHDFGKPVCRTTDEKGVDHFKKHPAASARIAETILKRLRFDNETIKKVLIIILNHDKRFKNVTKVDVKKLIVKIGIENFHLWCEMKRADIKSHSSMCFHELDSIDKCEELFNEIVKNGECISLRQLDINGTDLIKLGYKKDKIIGQTLEKLLELIICEQIANNKEALIKKAKEIMKGEK